MTLPLIGLPSNPLGASIGWAAGVSLGVGDVDQDGKAEICGRIECGLFAYATVFRTREVYGLLSGLEFKTGGRWFLVSWADVAQPEYTWWSFNRAARVAVVSVQTRDQSRTIHFFANDLGLADFARMQQAGARTTPPK